MWYSLSTGIYKKDMLSSKKKANDNCILLLSHGYIYFFSVLLVSEKQFPSLQIDVYIPTF